MAIINSKLILYDNETLFRQDLALTGTAKKILPTSIVFMKDTGRLWTQGNYFGGGIDHTHGPITNDGKIGTSANRIIETTTGGLLTHVAKNTAYNKAFGTGADQVARGNHTHDYAGLNTLPTTTKRDFVNGTLISTNINYANASGDPFYMSISGNTYGRNHSADTTVQGYIYNNTIINFGVTHKSFHGISGIIAMNVGGKLCFWFPRQSYWEGYSIIVTSALNYNINTITSITDVVKPVGTKEVDLSANTKQSAYHGDSLSLFNNNLGNYGNWITKAQGDTYYAPISHSNITGDNTIHHTHGNWANLNGINQALSTTSSPTFKAITLGTIYSTSDVSVLNGGSAQRILTGGLLASSAYADASKIPANGIYSRGKIDTLSHGDSSLWNTAYGWGNHASGGYVNRTGDTMTGTLTATSFIKL